MSKKRVETVLGPIDPVDLGVTFCHEHLSMDYQEAAFTPPTPRDPERENCGFSLENLGWIRQVEIEIVLGKRAVYVRIYPAPKRGTYS